MYKDTQHTQLSRGMVTNGSRHSCYSQYFARGRQRAKQIVDFWKATASPLGSQSTLIISGAEIINLYTDGFSSGTAF